MLQNFPVPPAFSRRRVLFPPRFPELEQGHLCLIQGHGGVRFSSGQPLLLDVLQLNKAVEATDSDGRCSAVNSSGKYRWMACIIPHRPSVAETEYTSKNSPDLRSVQAHQPKFAALMLSNPHPRDVLRAVMVIPRTTYPPWSHSGSVLLPPCSAMASMRQRDTSLPRGRVLHAVTSGINFFRNSLSPALRYYIDTAPLDLLSDVLLAHTAGVEA